MGHLGETARDYGNRILAERLARATPKHPVAAVRVQVFEEHGQNTGRPVLTIDYENRAVAEEVIEAAVAAVRDAHAALDEAMAYGDRAAVGRNKIARWVVGIHSRQVVLDRLSAFELAAHARRLTTDADIAPEDISITTGPAARVLVQITHGEDLDRFATDDPAERETLEAKRRNRQIERYNLAVNLEDGLHAAGLRLQPYRPRELAAGMSLAATLAEQGAVAAIARAGEG
jgi:hypothetical protein